MEPLVIKTDLAPSVHFKAPSGKYNTERREREDRGSEDGKAQGTIIRMEPDSFC